MTLTGWLVKGTILQIMNNITNEEREREQNKCKN